jgi:hypothetical protein
VVAGFGSSVCASPVSFGRALEPRIDRLAFQGEDAENAFVNPSERFSVDERVVATLTALDEDVEVVIRRKPRS